MTQLTPQQIIFNIMDRLTKQGILSRLPGNCILASDMIQNLLHAEGISSRIMEVEIIISKPNAQGMKSVAVVGYDDNRFDATMTDTHVVVITQGDSPLLIDASIGHLLGNSSHVIINELNSQDPEIICDVVTKQFEIVYRIKKNIRLPYYHQRDLLEKMKQEVKVQQNIKYIQMLALISIGVGVGNLLFNTVLMVLKLINP